jgi:hypothetical protein
MVCRRIASGAACIAHTESGNPSLDPGCNNDQFVLNWGTGTYNSNGSEIVANGVTAMGGDSGGPMLILADGGNIADLGLVGVNSLASRCAPSDSGNCGAAAARLDDLGAWLRALAQ